MIRIVDKRNGKVVQKVTKPNGDLVCYRAGIPGDYLLMKEFYSLWEAREEIGIFSRPAEARDAAVKRLLRV